MLPGSRNELQNRCHCLFSHAYVVTGLVFALYSEIQEILDRTLDEGTLVDGILLDIGVSSMQARAFRFHRFCLLSTLNAYDAIPGEHSPAHL